MLVKIQDRLQLSNDADITLEIICSSPARPPTQITFDTNIGAVNGTDKTFIVKLLEDKMNF